MKIQPMFIGIVRFQDRCRSIEDGRRIVAKAVGEYRHGGYEWRVAKEFPKDTKPDDARRAFEPYILRELP